MFVEWMNELAIVADRHLSEEGREVIKWENSIANSQLQWEYGLYVSEIEIEDDNIQR